MTNEEGRMCWKCQQYIPPNVIHFCNSSSTEDQIIALLAKIEVALDRIEERLEDMK